MAIFKRLLKDKNGDVVIPAMSVSGDYYVTTRVSTGQYSITSPFLPDPTDGMTIKVKFNYASSSGTPTLSINGGEYHYIRTTGSTTGSASTNTGALLNTTTVYEMIFTSSYGWIITNIHSKIKGEDIDTSSSMVSGCLSFSGSKSLSTTDITLATTPTLPAGKYLLIFNAGIHDNSAVTRTLFTRFSVTSPSASYDRLGGLVKDQYWNTVTTFAVVTLSSSTTIKMQLRGELSFTVNINEGNFAYIRIA